MGLIWDKPDAYLWYDHRTHHHRPKSVSPQKIKLVLRQPLEWGQPFLQPCDHPGPRVLPFTVLREDALAVRTDNLFEVGSGGRGRPLSNDGDAAIEVLRTGVIIGHAVPELHTLAREKLSLRCAFHERCWGLFAPSYTICGCLCRLVQWASVAHKMIWSATT